MSQSDRAARERLRAEKRSLSGVRVAAIWSVTLIIAVLIYAVGLAVMRHFNYRSWSNNINAALKQGDIARTEALLKSCREHAAYLTRRPDFAVWQRQLENLKAKEARKQQRFKSKLAKLRKDLEAENADPAILSMRLTDVARDCPDAAMLEDLRELQLRCEALARIRELSTAESGKVELAKLQELFADCQKLKKERNYEKFFELCQAGENRCGEFVRKYYNIAVAADQGRSLRRKFHELQSAGAADQKEFLASESAFSNLLYSASAEDLLKNCRNFCREHPASSRVGIVRKLASEVKYLPRQSWQKTFEKRLAKQQQDLAAAGEYLKQSIKKFLTGNYVYNLYRLALMLDDGSVVVFDSYVPAEFIQNNKQNIITITFKDIKDRQIRGEFTADGKGKILASGKVYYGKLYSGKPVGKLEAVYWQQKLKQLEGFDHQLNVPDVLDKTLPALISDQEIPEHLRKSLQNIRNIGVKLLGATPGQFVFNSQVWQACAGDRLIFAGIVGVTADGKKFFYRAANSRSGSDFWQMQLYRSKTVFSYQEKLHLLVTCNDEKSARDFTALHLLVMTEKTVNCRTLVAGWQKYAAANGLVMPELPEFLQFNR